MQSVMLTRQSVMLMKGIVVILMGVLVLSLRLEAAGDRRAASPERHATELPEVVVESRKNKILHILAYVRERSTLTTYTDTVLLFREKMVDYIINTDARSSFRGWTAPRVIKSESYYRFTNNRGLDSVSDASNHHFSWSDWIGPGISCPLPDSLCGLECAADTVMGKYSPALVWRKNQDAVTVDVNVLADSIGRRWVPELSGSFQKRVEFDKLRIVYKYDNVLSDRISPLDISSYSYEIESTGRGHGMFRFNSKDEPFFVATSAEVYVLDKEYISVGEARKWEHYKFDRADIEIVEPWYAPELDNDIKQLVARVSGIDREGIRLALLPDSKIGFLKEDNRNFQFGNRLLSLLKQVCGITLYKSRRNFNRRWSEFRNSRRNRNQPGD